MTDAEINQLIAKAETHFARYEWNEAIACFDAVLGKAPAHGAAVEGKRRAQQQLQAEALIVEAIARARQALESGNYPVVQTALDQAEGFAAKYNIQSYAPETYSLRAAAHERQRWQRQMDDTMKRAREYEAQGAIDEALDTVNKLLREMDAENMASLGGEARAYQDILLSKAVFNDKLKRARDAYRDQDYRLAARLADELFQERPNDQPTAQLYNTTTNMWMLFERQLQQVEEALGDQRLDDAVVLLKRLRESAPRNPDWQGLWLRGYMEHGQDRFETGRKDVRNHEFDKAVQDFADARAAFGAILEVFDTHALAAPLHLEAERLYEVAIHLAQGARDSDERRWELARQGFQEAADRLAEAQQVRSGEFGDMLAVVKTQQGEVQAIINALATAKSRLSEGQTLAGHKKLDRARNCFREGLEAVDDHDPALRESLLAELSRVDDRMDEVMTLSKEAHDATDDATRFTGFEQAYDKWPDAPDLVVAWGSALLAAADHALVTNNQAAAASYYAQVLAVEEMPADMKDVANEQLSELDALKAVEAALAEAKTLAERATTLPAPTFEAYQIPVTVLERAREYAGGNQRLIGRVEPLHRSAVARLAAVEAALSLTSQAENLRLAGDWAGAGRTLSQALEHLGEIPAPAWRDQIVSWQGAADLIDASLSAIAEARQQAEKCLEAARQGDLTKIQWNELDRALVAGEAVVAARPNVDPLPVSWSDQAAIVTDLRKRRNVLREAYDFMAAGALQDASRTIKAALDQRPQDRLFAAVHKNLQQELRNLADELVPRVIQQAQEAAERGNFAEAQELLRQARTYGASREVDEQLKRLDIQFATWQEISHLELDGEAKLRANSREDALQAFRSALELACDSKAGLPDQMHRQITSLLDLEHKLHLQPEEDKAEALVVELRSAAEQNYLLGRVLIPIMKRWYDMAQQKAHQGWVISRIEMGRLEEGLHLAQNDVDNFPNSPDTLQTAALAKTRLLESLLGNVRNRLNRARELREEGTFDKALAALDEIEIRWFSPVEQQFKDILRDNKEVEDIRRQADRLQREIVPLQAAAERLMTTVSEVRAAYVQNDLKQADELLTQAESIDTLRQARQAWLELDELREQVRRRHQAAVRTDVEQAVQEANIALDLAASADTLHPCAARLAALRPQVDDWLVGSAMEPDRERYVQVTARVATRINDLQVAKEAQRLSTAALASGSEDDLRQALKSLRRAEAVAQGEVLEHIRQQIDDLEIKLDKLEKAAKAAEEMQRAQKQMTTDWQDAVVAFEAGEYQHALGLFQAVRRAGRPASEVTPYLRAAQAGLLLAEIEPLVSQKPAEARRQIEDRVLPAVREFEPAAPVLLLAQAMLDRINATEKTRSSVSRLLDAADSALALGQLDDAQARMKEILDIQPDSPETQDLKKRIQDAVQARSLLDRANELHERDQYEAALQLAGQALVLNPRLVEAAILQAQLTSEVEAGQHLARASSLARENKFTEAREEMEMARKANPSHDKLTATQEEIGHQEERYKNRTLQPIMEARRAGKLRDAIYALIPLAASASVLGFKHEVSKLQEDLANQWADEVLRNAPRYSSTSTEAIDLKQLLTLRDTVREVLELTPGPTDPRPAQLRDLLRQVETVRLRHRLAEGREQLARDNLKTADGIRDEVEREARALELLPVIIDAGNFGFEVMQRQDEIDRQREDERRRQRQEEHDQAVTAAHGRLAGARSVADMKEAQRLVLLAMKVEGFADNIDDQALLESTAAQIAAYDSTKTALDEARRLLRRQNYRGAQDVLEEIDREAPLLQSEVETWLRLARDLERASSREYEAPDVALAAYQQAAAADANLARVLEPAILRCKGDLLDRTLIRVKSLLDAPVPDTTTALAQLQQAEGAGWITDDRQREVQALRAQASILVLTAQAAQALIDRQDTDGALVCLAQARDQTPGGQLDEQSAGWEATARLVQAVTRLEHDLRPADLNDAHQWSSQIPTTLDDQDIVKQARSSLNRLAAMVSSLQVAETQVQAALRASPPAFDQAVQAVKSLPDHTRCEALRTTVRDALHAAIAADLAQEHFDEVRPLVDQLRILLPAGDALPGQLLADSQRQREEAFLSALAEAEADLEADRLDTVPGQLQRASRLAGSSGESQIQALQKRLEERTAELRQVTDMVRQARTALAAQQLDGAVNLALQARALAPRYDQVMQFITDLRAALERLARGAMQAGRFPEVMTVCDQALRLGDEEPFPTLHREAVAAQERVLEGQRIKANQAYGRAMAALALFDLPTVGNALQQGREALPSDERFTALQERLGQAQNVAPQLRSEMESAWSQWEQRDFEAARKTLGQLTRLVPDFVEVQLWDRYMANIKDGVNLALHQEHDPAIKCFREAEACLRVSPEVTLSPLWGEVLRARRRNAVYYALRLGHEVHQIYQDRQKGNDLKQHKRFEEALDYLTRAKTHQDQLETFIKTAIQVPADFDDQAALSAAAGSLPVRPPAPVPPPPGETQRLPATSEAAAPPSSPATPVSADGAAGVDKPNGAAAAGTDVDEAAAPPSSWTGEPALPGGEPPFTTTPVHPPAATSKPDGAAAAIDEHPETSASPRSSSAPTEPPLVVSQAQPPPANSPAEPRPVSDRQATQPAEEIEIAVDPSFSFDDWFGGQTLVTPPPEEKAS